MSPNLQVFIMWYDISWVWTLCMWLPTSSSGRMQHLKGFKYCSTSEHYKNGTIQPYMDIQPLPHHLPLKAPLLQHLRNKKLWQHVAACSEAQGYYNKCCLVLWLHSLFPQKENRGERHLALLCFLASGLPVSERQVGIQRIILSSPRDSQLHRRALTGCTYCSSLPCGGAGQGKGKKSAALWDDGGPMNPCHSQNEVLTNSFDFTPSAHTLKYFKDIQSVSNVMSKT